MVGCMLINFFFLLMEFTLEMYIDQKTWVGAVKARASGVSVSAIPSTHLEAPGRLLFPVQSSRTLLNVSGGEGMVVQLSYPITYS